MRAPLLSDFTYYFEVEPLDLLVRGLLPLPLRRVVRLQLLVLPPATAVVPSFAQGCQMAKFDHFLSQGGGGGAQSKERKGSNFAA